eukprot:6251646-Pyramimonas_sp.AAC.1
MVVARGVSHLVSHSEHDVVLPRVELEVHGCGTSQSEQGGKPASQSEQGGKGAWPIIRAEKAEQCDTV